MSIFNLSIVTPLALLGLLAMAVPIYLHMRHKPRAEIQRFPALEFLLRAQRKRKRRFRVEQWLLMLFRLLIVAALAFLFAKPFVDDSLGAMGLKNQKPLLLILDDSASMLAKQGDSRFFDAAIDDIRDILSRRSNNSPTVLFLASNPMLFQDATTNAQVRDRLQGLNPTMLSPVLDEAYSKALETLTTQNWQQATLRIYTDGSKTAWRNLPTNKPDQLEVVYASQRKQGQPLRNVGLALVQQAPGDRRTVEVGLINGGSQLETVELKMESPEGGVVRQSLRTPPFGRMSHRFGLEETMPSTLTFNLPQDDFDLDNEVEFAPGSSSTVKVLLVDGDSHPDPVSSESFFFKNAMGMDESEKYGFTQEVITPAGLSAQKVQEFDVICLFNVDAVNMDLLSQALAKGKGVFISMGSFVESEAWKSFLAPFEIEIWESKALDVMQPIDIRTFDHPFFQPIEESEWRNYLQGAGIAQYRILTTGRSRVEVPLALPDGAPLLLAKETLPGRLMIWASSVDMDWTNFPIQFGYVPFVRQILGYLSDQGSATSATNLTVDDVLAQDLETELVPKTRPKVFQGLSIRGPVPGVYTRQIGTKTEFVQVGLDPDEMNFQSFKDQQVEEEESNDRLAQLGFQSTSRADLGPSIQWIIFLLLLVETLVAGRLSLNWGSR